MQIWMSLKLIEITEIKPCFNWAKFLNVTVIQNFCRETREREQTLYQNLGAVNREGMELSKKVWTTT